MNIHNEEVIQVKYTELTLSCTCYFHPLILLVSWLCLSITGISYPKTLPCDISNITNSSEVIVDCTERGLKKIPPGIPGETTNLTLTINHIPLLNSSSFQGLENLVEIDMRCNCVPIKIGPKDHMCTHSVKIEEKTFTKLENLQALYLDGNQLESIPKGLPENLILLSLEVNHIFQIFEANLSEIRNIEILYLGQNCYYRNPCNESYAIEESAFSQLHNLTLLSLKSNNLSFIPPRLPTSLKELYLYNNNIQKVNDKDFNYLTNLEILDISGNCPRCYNAPFPCTPCPDNSPLSINETAFHMLKKLKTLRLHSNSLSHVQPEWFANTKQLRVLDLSSNFLAKDLGLTHFPKFLLKLKELDLSFNYELQRYPESLRLSQSFSSLKSLKILRLKGFVFQQLRHNNIDPLKALPNLEVLDLGTNFIKIANLSMLMELKSFKIISLSDNKISSPSDGHSTIGYSIREPLNWSPLSYKDKELGDIASLVKKECSQFGKTLDVSRNNIFFLHPTFLNLKELRCLNLSGNAMSQSLNGSEFTHLTQLKYLDFSSNRLDLLYSTAFEELKNLVILDISNNNHYFESEGLTHMLNFTRNLKNLKVLLINHNQISASTNTEIESQSLEKLEFKGNRLDILWKDGNTKYVNYFKKLYNLTVLDISSNNLHEIQPQVFSGLPDKLSELYLKNNKLNSFIWKNLCYLHSLLVLDLSGNSLTTVPPMLSDCTTSLKKLILHKNQIVKLTSDFLKNAFNLKYLDLSYNHIQNVEESSFPDNVVNQMDMLLLHNNRFHCSCNATWFVKWLNKTTVTIPKLGTDVTCANPGAQRGHLVISVDLLACQHNGLSIILYILLTSLILSFLTMSISSHLFLWDIWYIFYFFRAKLKGYRHLTSKSTIYDAFVIYDKEDQAVSEWVMKEMCFHLEKHGDHPLTLCVEERDWIPGCPLIDNLSQSIYRSKRTVFILTNKYIKGGKFKTAFYMAHQRLMDEKDDVIVLIFLEKTCCNSKYLRLRKRLYSRSVMEWPSNPQAQPYFWFSLRMSTKYFCNYFTMHIN
uniref:TIR domain-containing protein n=1 Tax=Gouania willdenowi TaxID=441366 RepID=A0A8C5NI09_GOUWI